MQMTVTRNSYCDFIVCNSQNYYYERIPFNKEFWERESKIAKTFFYDIILLEMLGRYFTRKSKEEEITKDWEALKNPPSTSSDSTKPIPIQKK